MAQILKEHKVESKEFLAKELFNERKFDKAFPITLEADQNDPQIVYNLGFMYYFGKGVKCDRKKGAFLVKKADEMGCRYADKVLRWMIFDMRERFWGHLFGIVMGITGMYFAWTAGPADILSVCARLTVTFIGTWYLFFNIFSIIFAACNRYFMYLGERVGMFFFSFIGVIGGGLLLFLVYIAILAMANVITPERQSLISAIGTIIALFGAVAGFRIGRNVGACIGESTIQAITTHE